MWVTAGSVTPKALATSPMWQPGCVGHVEEHLRLRVGEVELGGALPEELPEDRAAERVEQVEQALGLRRPARLTCSGPPRRHRIMVHLLNS